MDNIRTYSNMDDKRQYYNNIELFENENKLIFILEDTKNKMIFLEEKNEENIEKIKFTFISYYMDLFQDDIYNNNDNNCITKLIAEEVDNNSNIYIEAFNDLIIKKQAFILTKLRDRYTILLQNIWKNKISQAIQEARQRLLSVNINN